MVMKNVNIRIFLCIIVLFLTANINNVCAQESRTEFMVNFRVSSSRIDTGYMDNAAKIEELVSALRSVQTDSTITITSITFCGAASPEGSYELNRNLAARRLKALEEIVRSKIDIPDSIVAYNDSYIPWEQLVCKVTESDMQHKHEILTVIAGTPEIVDYPGGRRIDNRILKLQRLDGGKVWKELLRRFFSPMRNACVVFVTCKQQPQPVVALPEPLTVAPSAATDTVQTLEPLPVVADTVPAVDEWSGKLHVKTNALGLGLAIANAAVEADLCRHWSVTLPVCYSAWDYFCPTTKFRTLAVQPELRYWLSENNDAWFLGAHFGLAWYNIATDGRYRIQDHGGKSPALGGGLAVGYRMPISRSKRWKMEFSVGAGAYRLHYDKFRNNTNGLLVNTEKTTYIGIDQASLSFSYTFDLKRKGGAR